MDERNFQVSHGQVPRVALYPNVEVKNVPSSVVAFEIEIHIVRTLIPKAVCHGKRCELSFEGPSSNTFYPNFPAIPTHFSDGIQAETSECGKQLDLSLTLIESLIQL